jgi:hypothetical protein
MILTRNRSLVIIAIGILCLFFVGFFLHFTLIGPGYPPNADFSYLAFSEGGSILMCNSSTITVANQSFCLENIHEQNYPLFHELSPKSRYGKIKNTGTGDKFVIAVWHFDTTEKFVNEEAQLLRFVGDNGIVSTIELDMTSEQEIIRRKILEKSRDPGFVVPQKLLTTAYIGNNTTGYFFAVKKPVSWDREDYFIEYYGTIDNDDFSSQASSLRMLIAENYGYYTFRGGEGPLVYE